MSHFLFYFFFNDTATTEIYTLSLHDALPISIRRVSQHAGHPPAHPLSDDSTPGYRSSALAIRILLPPVRSIRTRSEEHTSELQSHLNLVCRLLLEKKKNIQPTRNPVFTIKAT